MSRAAWVALGLIGLSAAARGETERSPGADLDLVPDSVACGASNRGALSDSAALAPSGEGYVVPSPWLERGLRFGTRELVGLVQRAASRVAREHPGALLAVADLSAEHGGPVAQHRSHQNGRDVDLIYYALDGEGQPFAPDSHMAYYNARGQATYARSPAFARGIPTRYFDLPRNWALVRALIGDTDVRVVRIFVSTRVKRWLLRYAEEADEPAEVIAAARRVLRRPRDASGHNDHMHVRIGCSADDVALGRCLDRSAPRRRRARWRRHIPCPAIAAE